MKFYNTTKLALILEQQALIEGMKAANSQHQDRQPYWDGDFVKAASKLNSLSKLPDCIEEKDKKEKEKHESAPKESVMDFIYAYDYCPAQMDGHNVKFDKMSNIIYKEYRGFCYEFGYHPLSHILFSAAFSNSGFCKARRSNGVFYTVFCSDIIPE